MAKQRNSSLWLIASPLVAGIVVFAGASSSASGPEVQQEIQQIKAGVKFSSTQATALTKAYGERLALTAKLEALREQASRINPQVKILRNKLRTLKAQQKKTEEQLNAAAAKALGAQGALMQSIAADISQATKLVDSNAPGFVKTR